MRNQETKDFFKKNGWNFVWIDGVEIPPAPRPTHLIYGASVIIAPRLMADLHNKTVEVMWCAHISEL